MIFEVVAADMPGSIASGGRYDHLISALGGPDVPACGGSLGVERIIGLIESGAKDAGRIDVAIPVMTEESGSDVVDFANQLRNADLRTEIYLGTSRKFSKQLKWAADRRARFALIYGQQEQDAGIITVRDMDSGEQNQVPTAELAAHLKGRCATPR